MTIFHGAVSSEGDLNISFGGGAIVHALESFYPSSFTSMMFI